MKEVRYKLWFWDLFILLSVVVDYFYGCIMFYYINVLLDLYFYEIVIFVLWRIERYEVSKFYSKFGREIMGFEIVWWYEDEEKWEYYREIYELVFVEYGD